MRAGLTATAIATLVAVTTLLLHGVGAGASAKARVREPLAVAPAAPPTGPPGRTPDHTVPVGRVPTLPPVPLESAASFGTGLRVRLGDITATQADARVPGEISGPAIAVRLSAENQGQRPVSLDSVAVFLTYGSDRAPASLFGSATEPLTGELERGTSRSGVYVFAVPPDGRDDVRLEVSYTGTAPTVAFEGAVDG